MCWKSTCKSYDSSLIAFTEVQDWIWPMRVGSSVSTDLTPSLSGIWLEKLTAKPRSVIGLYICLARLIPGFTALILTGSSVSMNLSRWCDKATNSSSKQNELKLVFLKRNITHAVPNYHIKEWEGCLETQEVHTDSQWHLRNQWEIVAAWWLSENLTGSGGGEGLFVCVGRGVGEIF